MVAFRQVTASLESQRRVLRRAERQSRLPFSAEDDLVLSGPIYNDLGRAEAGCTGYWSCRGSTPPSQAPGSIFLLPWRTATRHADLLPAAGTRAPGKNDSLDHKDAPYAVAEKRPGILLWRHDEDPYHAGGFEGHPWLAGAEEARHFRAADVQRYNDNQQAARERRKHRRRERRVQAVTATAPLAPPGMEPRWLGWDTSRGAR